MTNKILRTLYLKAHMHKMNIKDYELLQKMMLWKPKP